MCVCNCADRRRCHHETWSKFNISGQSILLLAFCFLVQTHTHCDATVLKYRGESITRHFVFCYPCTSHAHAVCTVHTQQVLCSSQCCCHHLVYPHLLTTEVYFFFFPLSAALQTKGKATQLPVLLHYTHNHHHFGVLHPSNLFPYTKAVFWLQAYYWCGQNVLMEPFPQIVSPFSLPVKIVSET